jgi:hypothetical protein
VYTEARTVLRAVVTDSSAIVGVWRSVRITVFGTNQGASAIMRKALDWNLQDVNSVALSLQANYTD